MWKFSRMNATDWRPVPRGGHRSSFLHLPGRIPPRARNAAFASSRLSATPPFGPGEGVAKG
jgi:hypothetical protein